MIKIPSVLVWFVLTIIASAALYHTSYRVHQLQQEMRTLNAQIDGEQRNIHVLKAEWVYLANPARIEMAARRHLGMQPTNLKQIARLEDLPEMIPARANRLPAEAPHALAQEKRPEAAPAAPNGVVKAAASAAQRAPTHTASRPGTLGTLAAGESSFDTYLLAKAGTVP